MGAVYRATDTRLNRDVAIKVLRAALAGDAQYRARFEREAQTLASLNRLGSFVIGWHPTGSGFWCWSARNGRSCKRLSCSIGPRV